jgi:hypothetical protein
MTASLKNGFSLDDHVFSPFHPFKFRELEKKIYVLEVKKFYHVHYHYKQSKEQLSISCILWFACSGNWQY